MTALPGSCSCASSLAFAACAFSNCCRGAMQGEAGGRGSQGGSRHGSCCSGYQPRGHRPLQPASRPGMKLLYMHTHVINFLCFSHGGWDSVHGMAVISSKVGSKPVLSAALKQTSEFALSSINISCSLLPRAQLHEQSPSPSAPVQTWSIWHKSPAAGSGLQADMQLCAHAPALFANSIAHCSYLHACYCCCCVSLKVK